MTTPALWSEAVTDSDGTWELRILADEEDPTERLVIDVNTESSEGHLEAIGLSLGRDSVQQVRNAITVWLVDTAPLVGEP